MAINGDEPLIRIYMFMFVKTIFFVVAPWGNFQAYGNIFLLKYRRTAVATRTDNPTNWYQWLNIAIIQVIENVDT